MGFKSIAAAAKAAAAADAGAAEERTGNIKSTHEHHVGATGQQGIYRRKRNATDRFLSLESLQPHGAWHQWQRGGLLRLSTSRLSKLSFSLPLFRLIWQQTMSSSLIARFIGPTWDPSGADRTQVGSMLASWILLSALLINSCLTMPSQACKYTIPNILYSGTRIWAYVLAYGINDTTHEHHSSVRQNTILTCL